MTAAYVFDFMQESRKTFGANAETDSRESGVPISSINTFSLSLSIYLPRDFRHSLPLPPLRPPIIIVSRSHGLSAISLVRA